MVGIEDLPFTNGFEIYLELVMVMRYQLMITYHLLLIHLVNINLQMVHQANLMQIKMVKMYYLKKLKSEVHVILLTYHF